MSKVVTLEEKLIAQAKNINAIYKSERSPVEKVMLLELQMDYLNAFVDALVEPIKEQILKGGNIND